MKKSYLNKRQFEAETAKCLDCRTMPCKKACPLGCSPCEFIKLARKHDFAEAAYQLYRYNPLAHICGFVCPDSYCVKACLRAKIDNPINIAAVQAFIAAKNLQYSQVKSPLPNGLRIAVVGAGPAGMAACWRLAKMGYEVCVFEKDDVVGGALNLIPDYRLPRNVIEADWQYILQCGNITSCFNSEISNFEKLLDDGFDGVIVAVGENKEKLLGITGEESLVSYKHYLQQLPKYASAKNVAIIGGGNVAVDCALSAKKMGANSVSIFVRRKFFDMKISKSEMKNLFDNKVDIITTTRICELKSGLNGIDIATCSTCEFDNKYKDIENSLIWRNGFDLVVRAIGSTAVNHAGSSVIINAGDCKNGSSTVVEAVKSGIDAAELLNKNLEGENK